MGEEEIERLHERIVEVEKIVPVEKVEVRKIPQEFVKEVLVDEYKSVDIPYTKVKPHDRKERGEEVIVQQVSAQQAQVPVERIQYKGSKEKMDVVSPMPVEAVTCVEFNLPNIVPVEKKKTYPVFLPRFIEVPVSRQFAEQSFIDSQSKGGIYSDVSVLEKLRALMKTESVSLCEIENFASNLLNTDTAISRSEDKHVRQEVVSNNWRDMVQLDSLTETVTNAMYQSEIQAPTALVA